MQSPLNRHQHHTKVLDTSQGRILCVADIRGRLSALNDLARDAHAHAIIHTGDFGFFESHSIEKINDRTLRHLAMYSPLIPSAQRTHLLSQDNPNPSSLVRSTVNVAMISEFPLLLSGQIKLQVPVYTVWGACEDVVVLEKFRSKAYVVENLHIIDEATTRLIDVGGVKLRLLGLGGALVPHKMFDNGDGKATIAGGQGTMWTTALQIGELVDTAQRVFDSTETRLLVTHTSPGREGIIAQLALVLKADLTVSAGLHFRYATSYNEFSVQGDFEGFRHKLAVGKETFDKVWGSVKSQVENVIDSNQRILLDKALSVVERIPSTQPSTGPGATATGPGATATGEEPAWKNCWNWNLCDAAYGSLVLDIKEGRISAELKSQGFNYAYRRTATMATTPNSTSTALPPQSNSQPPTKGHTPAPDDPASLHVAETNKAIAHTSPPVATAVLAPNQDVKLNGNTASEKTDKDKSKKKDKKDRKEKRDGGTSTPEVPASTSTPTPSEPALPPPDTGKQEAEETKSPTESMGVRTPKTNRPPRHPWTIFMRLSNQITVNEGDIKEFFGEAQGGITKVTIPTSYPAKPNKVAFVEFGDEDAMKNGLEKHAEKLKDTIPEVKQASDKESRPDHHSLRGPRGGRRGGYAARGLSAAGLTRRHDNRDSGEAGVPVKTSNGIENT